MNKVLVLVLALVVLFSFMVVSFGYAIENSLNEDVLSDEALQILEESIQELGPVETIETLSEGIEEQKTVQYGAVIGKPVKWKKKVVLTEENQDIIIEVPEEAQEIVIRDELDQIITEAQIDGTVLDKSERVSQTTLDTITDFYESSFGGFITFLFSVQMNDLVVFDELGTELVENEILDTNEEVEQDVIVSDTDASEASNEEETPKENEIDETDTEQVDVSESELDTDIVDEILDIDTNQDTEELIPDEILPDKDTLDIDDIDANKVSEKEIEILIEELVEEIEIEYETPGPQAEETETGHGKTVLVYSDIHYQNVLTFSGIKNTPRQSIRLYWQENSEGEVTDVTDDPSVNLQMYDTDGDELVDYLEWITPHTSNQTFVISLTVLNPYEFLRDGEDWIVAFNTTGIGDLLISSPNANWTEEDTDDEDTVDEMSFINLTCGQTDLAENITIIGFDNKEYQYTDLEDTSIKPRSFLLRNYSCDDTGYFSNYMHKAGYAILQLNFSNQTHTLTDYAYDPDCYLTANYVQTADNATCTNIYTDGFNWTTDGYNLSTGDVIINGTNSWINGNNSYNITVDSLIINSGNTYNATSGTTVIISEASTGRALDNDGTFTHNDGTVNITTGAHTLLEFSGSGNLYNLIASTSGNLLYTPTGFTIDNNLTVNSGTFKPWGVETLTVSGDTIINSGILDGKTTTVSFGALTINSGGTYDATTATTTITGIFDNYGTFTHNDGTVEFAPSATYNIQSSGSTEPVFYNVIKSGVQSSTLRGDITVINELNVTGGILAINSATGELTVTFGNATQSGTLRNDATTYFRRQTNDLNIFGASIDYPGIITGTPAIMDIRSGTHNWKWLDFQQNIDTDSGDADTITLNLLGDVEFDNLTVSSGDTLTITNTAQANFSGDFTVIGDLTVDGNITGVHDAVFNVTGNVTANGLLNASNSTLSTLGSLTIGSGGTYDAMSLTTITGETSGGLAIDNDGTFTHNDGLVNITTGADTLLDFDGTGNPANLNISTGSNTVILSDNAVIDGDLVVTSGVLDTNLTDNLNLTVTGAATLAGTGNLTGRAGYHSLGSLTIGSGTLYNATSGTTTINGNFTNDGTFTNNSGRVGLNATLGYLLGVTVFNNLTISGNMTLLSDANYTNISVTSSGNLTYNVSHYDNGMVYYKTPGGFVSITGSSILTSNASYFNGTTDSDKVISNTPSSDVWVDVIEAGSTWTITGWDSTAPTVDLNAPDNNTNTTSQNITFNFTAVEETSLTVNCSLYIDNVYESGNATTPNNTLTNLNGTNIGEGVHDWNITCADAASNSNTSVTRRFTIDATAPTVDDITYTKVGVDNSSDSIDPNVAVLFNTSVNDTLFDVDKVILEYHNGTGWINSTMTNSAGTWYNTTVTLISTEVNYTYRVFANDSLGNINQTTNQTFDSSWDCTWNSTTDLGTDTGWDDNKWIGNITINNTGDANFSDNSCTLEFSLTHDLAGYRRIWYKIDGEDWEYLEDYKGYFGEVAAKNNLTIQVNASFESEIAEEDLVITLDEFRIRSTAQYNNVSGTLVTNQQGPYLLQEVTTPSDGAIYYLTDQTISFSGHLRNIMGSIPENATNTAHNVTFNWTLATGFTTTDDLTLNYTNISNSSWHTNAISVTFSDLSTMTAGAKTFSLVGSGFNSTSDLISYANNGTSLTDSINITFLCYGVSDGLCVEDCGYTQDPDCEQTTVTTTTATSSGGGGGGKSKAKSIKIYEVFDLIRGKNQNYEMYVKNRQNLTATVTVEVSGFNSKYIRVDPDKFTLEPYENKSFTTYIEAPSYFTRGQHNLTYTILLKNKDLGGAVTTFKENRAVSLNIYEIPIGDATKALDESKSILEELKDANFTVKGIESLIKEAERYLADNKYLEVNELAEQIKEIKEIVLEVDSSLKEIEKEIANAEYYGLVVPKTERLTNLARAALSRGDFFLAKDRIEEAKIVSSLETKGEINWPYFIYRNWQLVLVTIVLLSCISIIVYLRVKLYTLSRELRNLSKEQGIVLGLIKQIQNECFVEKRLSMSEYLQAISQYEKRLSSNVNKIITLETEKSHIFGLNEIKKLHDEMRRLLDLLKQTQVQYLKSGSIQTNLYQQKMKFLTKRITEVEEKMTVLEAKQEIESKTNPMLLFLGHHKILARKNLFRFGRGLGLW